MQCYRLALLCERTTAAGMVSVRFFLCLRRAMSLQRSWRASRAPAQLLAAVVVAAVAAVVAVAGAEPREPASART